MIYKVSCIVVESLLIVLTTFNSLGPSIVQAELINEDYNPIMKKKNSAPAIQNGEEPLDENGVVCFPFYALFFTHNFLFLGRL